MIDRMAIEALRAGVPNGAATRRLADTDKAIGDAFQEALDACRSGLEADRRAEGLVVAGGFGSGKSHLLGVLREGALHQGFVVSLVPISKETPLFDPERIFTAAMRNAVVQDGTDDITTTLRERLRPGSEAYHALEQWASGPAAGLSPIFAALLHLFPREMNSPETMAAFDRFLAGGKLGVNRLRQLLRNAGAAGLFEIKTVKAPELALQRLRFMPRLLAAAGFAGWCILFDEVELIGRYGIVQRGRSYAELCRWLGLDPSVAVPGIVTVAAISDDFASTMLDTKRDDETIPPRLEARGQERQARLAALAMRVLERRAHLIPAPDEPMLRATLGRVARLYQGAYGWEPPIIDIGERRSVKTMRQYIKSWITEWDLQRLYHEHRAIEVGELETDYSENTDIEQAPVDDDRDEA